MSIIIKGMDMPKDGNEVFIIIKPNGEVRDGRTNILGATDYNSDVTCKSD